MKLTTIQLVIVIVGILLVGIAVFLIVNRKTKYDSMVGGGGDMSNFNPNMEKVFIVVDEFEGRRKLLRALHDRNLSFITISTRDLESPVSKIRQEIVRKSWDEKKFVILLPYVDSEKEKLIDDLSSSSLNVTETYLLSSSSNTKYTRIVVDKNHLHSFEQIYGENKIVVKDINQALTHILDHSEDDEVVDDALNDYASVHGGKLSSKNLKLVRKGRKYTIFQLLGHPDKAVIKVRRIGGQAGKPAWQNARTVGAVAPGWQAGGQQTSQAGWQHGAQAEGLARVLERGDGWMLVEGLKPIDRVDEGKLAKLHQNLMEYFSSCDDKCGLFDFSRRNIMKNQEGDYVIVDFDLTETPQRLCQLGAENVPKYDKYLRFCDKSAVLETSKAFFHKRFPRMKYTTPRRLSIVALELWRLSGYDMGLYITPEILSGVTFI